MRSEAPLSAPAPFRRLRALDWRRWALGLPLLALTAGCAHSREQEEKEAKGFYPEEGDETPADKHYKVALGSFHNGLFDDARIQLQRALSSNEEHGPSHYLEGLLYLREGKTMLDAVEGEMCLQDASADLQRDRIDDLHSQARGAFVKSVDGFDDRAAGRGRAFNSLSVVSLYFHEYDRAAEEAEKALSTDFYSERFSALANLGWAYYQRGDRVEAMTELRQSILLNPDFCVARYRLAQVYLDFEMTQEALEEVQRVLANERCPIQDARRVEGVARLRLGDTEGASQSFEACIAMAPRSCLADECEGYLELAQGVPAAASTPAG